LADFTRNRLLSRKIPSLPICENAMFTGIVMGIGRVLTVTPLADGVHIAVDSRALELEDVRLGDSIAHSGVCLTVVDLPGNGFAADVSRETLDCTAMSDLKAGSPVNLEKP